MKKRSGKCGHNLWWGIVFVLMLLFGLSAPCFAKAPAAEQWIKTVYNEENGLITGEANVVLQTRDGYLWIGSYGGLIRYDGKNFRNFSVEENDLDSSSIRALYETSDGRLFIGTNDVGVYLYEEGEFTAIPCEDGSGDFYSVRSFAESLDGTVYVGTTSGLARVTDADGLKLCAVEESRNSIIYDLACDRDDVLWACSDNGMILLVKDGEVLEVTDSTGWLEEDCYSILAGSDGCVYLGSSGNEISRLEKTGTGLKKEDFSVLSISTEMLHTINRLYEDKEGNLWAMADNGIGFVGEDGSFQMPEEMEDVISAGSMIEDYEGNLWVASTKTGLVYFSRGKYYNYNRTAGLEGIAVNAIVRCDGYSYVGTDDGLLILNEEFQQISNELTKTLSSERVRHITCGSDGSLWFSLYGAGLARYVPKEDRVRIFTTEDGLLSNQVRMTLELMDGTLAVAGTAGIDILKDETVIRSYGEKELPYPFILCMYQEKDGTLVAGSDGMGIYRINDSGVTQYYKEEGLESGTVMRMAPDENGVWVSAGNSLYFWDENGIRRLPFHTGVGSILDIQVMGSRLWLMKSHGPMIVEKEELLSKDADPRELSGEYGLTGTLPANSWNWLEEDGTLWICTNNGISMINTESIPENKMPPKGTISQVMVDDVAYEGADEIRVSASATRITLEPSVMSYTLGDKTIRYSLEGFDEKAVTRSVSEVSGVSYTNLSGGDYVFTMTVYNEDGVQGDSCQVKIHKECHVWEKAWFWGIAGVGILLIVLLLFQMVYRIKIRRLKRRQAEYRSIVEQALHTFANAIDAKDKDTNGHSLRVAKYSRELARRMKMTEDQQENISYMAMLHDIGKIGIPDSILKKQGKLTKEEWEVIKSHPRIGGEILKEFTAIPGIADGARYHHEFYNGKGYCEGLKGEEIPLMARIIAVADAFDAMCSKRYYQSGNTVEFAREELIRCSGTQFDPQVAEFMVEMIDDGFVKKVTGVLE